jgi:hypothetical protein
MKNACNKFAKGRHITINLSRSQQQQQQQQRVAGENEKIPI